MFALDLISLNLAENYIKEMLPISYIEKPILRIGLNGLFPLQRNESLSDRFLTIGGRRGILSICLVPPAKCNVAKSSDLDFYSPSFEIHLTRHGHFVCGA